uniref:Uncharacterized protein n=1 Tax=Solanum tuberosum TaxID=4113 RepID=M1DM56_SOLTU
MKNMSIVLKAKNEESKRHKSKSLEMKPSSSPSFQNPLKTQSKNKNGSFGDISRNRRSTRDSPFSVVHRRFAQSFNIAVFWVIGKHGTASRNFSVIRRLLHFSADLILSFRAQHTSNDPRAPPTVTSVFDLSEVLYKPLAFVIAFIIEKYRKI